ncbi:ADP-forming succinate--CoA ligase subunit beta [Flavobacteriaceae bacterium]|nr:ADP-forming succinate--CoA ligase subunit beta [Flavobacteriaceae bacterium]
MNLHEYQAKEILKSFGVKVPMEIVAATPEEAVIAANKIQNTKGCSVFAVKAQIHAGGRGKGGGVKIAKSIAEVDLFSEQILGMMLVTPQTSAEGKEVRKVLISENVYYEGENEPEEFYMSVLLNRNTGRNMIMYSTEGGMDIETVADETPELIFTEEIDPTIGIQGFQVRRIAFNLGLSGAAFKDMTKFATALYNAYEKCDASLFEINPVFKTADNQILAVDAKVSLDDNALFRHRDYASYRDLLEENPIEVEANAAGLNYVALDGNVGCMVNGAGLAMATMDLIKEAGGEPANFLDVGGTADAARVEKAFRIILRDSKVRAIFVNIFGGIVRCDRVAQGVVDAYTNMRNSINVPIIVRLQGTNAAEAKLLIDAQEGLDVISAIEFQEAADKVHDVLV